APCYLHFSLHDALPIFDAGSDHLGTWGQWAGVDALDADAPLNGRQGTEAPAWRGGEGSDGAGGEPAAGWPGLLEQGDEAGPGAKSEEHTSELQSREKLV